MAMASQVRLSNVDPAAAADMRIRGLDRHEEEQYMEQLMEYIYSSLPEPSYSDLPEIDVGHLTRPSEPPPPTASTASAASPTRSSATSSPASPSRTLRAPPYSPRAGAMFGSRRRFSSTTSTCTAATIGPHHGRLPRPRRAPGALPRCSHQDGFKASASTMVTSVKILSLEVRFGVRNDAKMVIWSIHISSKGWTME